MLRNCALLLFCAIFSCAQDCEHIAVDGRVGSNAVINGDYAFEGTHNDKPYYKKTGPDVYLYFNENDNDATLSNWNFGPRLGNLDTYAHNMDQAQSPDLVEESWIVYQDPQFLPDPNVIVTCGCINPSTFEIDVFTSCDEFDEAQACTYTECPGLPTAVCSVNSCGGCWKSWKNDAGYDVFCNPDESLCDLDVTGHGTINGFYSLMHGTRSFGFPMYYNEAKDMYLSTNSVRWWVFSLVIADNYPQIFNDQLVGTPEQISEDWWVNGAEDYDFISISCVGCSVHGQEWLGDGDCDTFGDYNTAQCNFDGGDCCPETCQNGKSFLCADNLVQECLDLNHYEGATTYPGGWTQRTDFLDMENPSVVDIAQWGIDEMNKLTQPALPDITGDNVADVWGFLSGNVLEYKIGLQFSSAGVSFVVATPSAESQDWIISRIKDSRTDLEPFDPDIGQEDGSDGEKSDESGVGQLRCILGFVWLCVFSCWTVA